MDVEVVIEIPARTGNKYDVDRDTGALRLDRHPVSAAGCPLEYGFIEGTVGPDGDPMATLVALEEPGVPGCRLTPRPVAVLWICSGERREPKSLCVPTYPDGAIWDDLGNVPERLRRETGQFFEIYKDIDNEATSPPRVHARRPSCTS